MNLKRRDALLITLVVCIGLLCLGSLAFAPQAPWIPAVVSTVGLVMSLTSIAYSRRHRRDKD
jgi:CHASE2 domain-containing sensor protein